MVFDPPEEIKLTLEIDIRVSDFVGKIIEFVESVIMIFVRCGV